jgi:hypothetical protein
VTLLLVAAALVVVPIILVEGVGLWLGARAAKRAGAFEDFKLRRGPEPGWTPYEDNP